MTSWNLSVSSSSSMVTHEIGAGQSWVSNLAAASHVFVTAWLRAGRHHISDGRLVQCSRSMYDFSAGAPDMCEAILRGVPALCRA